MVSTVFIASETITIFLFVNIDNKMNACCLYNIVFFLICKSLDILLISCENYVFFCLLTLPNVFYKIVFKMHLKLQSNRQQFGIGTSQIIWNSTWFLNFWHKKSKEKNKGSLILLFRTPHSASVVSSFQFLVSNEYSNLPYTIDQRKDSFLFPFLKKKKKKDPTYTSYINFF